MKTYISILRGINVSGHKVIKMVALKDMYERLNCTNIQTYIQSGNVVFQHENSDTASLAQRISDKILQHFGFEVPVIVMDIEKLKRIVADNPFIADPDKDISFLHVTFLSSPPEMSLIYNLKMYESIKSPGKDEYVLSSAAIYLYCPNGYGRTKLTNTFFENKLKVTATTRNWRTSLELLEIANSV